MLSVLKLKLNRIKNNKTLSIDKMTSITLLTSIMIYI